MRHRAQNVGEAGADGRGLGLGGGGVLTDDLADPRRRQLQLRSHLRGAAERVPGEQKQNLVGQLVVPGHSAARWPSRQRHGAEVRLPLDDHARRAPWRHWVCAQCNDR